MTNPIYGTTIGQHVVEPMIDVITPKTGDSTSTCMVKAGATAVLAVPLGIATLWAFAEFEAREWAQVITPAVRTGATSLRTMRTKHIKKPSMVTVESGDDFQPDVPSTETVQRAKEKRTMRA